MKTVLAAVAGFVLLLSAVTVCAQREIMDGNELKRRLATRLNRENTEAYWEGMGHWGELIQSKDSSVACVPSQVKLGQVIDVVYKYLVDHPEKLHEDSRVLFRTALMLAFPCQR